MMDETKVQIGDDVLLDIGTHSDWYISAICYDNESVNVELRRKIDRNNKWWVTEQDEPQIEPNLILPERMERGETYEVGDSIVVMNSEDYYDLLCKSWEKDEPQTDTEIAKAIVHKMIDNTIIADDTYPDLRQKMHDAVDEYEPQTNADQRIQGVGSVGSVEQTERSSE